MHAMQGMMGSYLDKNIQTFVEIQRRLQEQACRSSATIHAQCRGLEPVRKNAGADDPGLMSSYLEQERQHLPRHATDYRNRRARSSAISRSEPTSAGTARWAVRQTGPPFALLLNSDAFKQPQKKNRF